MAPNNETKVCILGSGNWGSTIARIVGDNCAREPSLNTEVKMWVFEEMVDGRKLTEIINEDHENVKYLPGKKLPKNVVAVPDSIAVVKDADILLIVIPHEFLPRLCTSLKGHVKPTAHAMSLCKGLDVDPTNGNPRLLSKMVTDNLGIKCSVLMGANIANEVAEECFCEATIGCGVDRNTPEFATVSSLLKLIVQASYFRIRIVPDVTAVELCGALKNIVACAAGFCDGLAYGNNTKAAVIRIGLQEMIQFCNFYQEPPPEFNTFLESCGVADLVATCYGGRNRRLSAAFAEQFKDDVVSHETVTPTNRPAALKSLEDLAVDMLNGQKLQGPITAKETYLFLKSRDMLSQYPLLVAVHLACSGSPHPVHSLRPFHVKDLVELLQNHY